MATRWKPLISSVFFFFFLGICSSSRHSWVIQLHVDTLSEMEFNDFIKDLRENHGFEYKGRVANLHDTFKFHLTDNKDQLSKITDEEAMKVIKSSVHEHLNTHKAVKWHNYQHRQVRVKRESPSHKYQFNDPFFPDQWYLYNREEEHKGHDIDVMSVWAEGITGENVGVCVVDDGVDHKNPDIAVNYNHKSSYDYIDDDNDPTPTNDDGNDHGTKCAGVIAAGGNNKFCGIGIAYMAKIAGVRILDDAVTDLREAEGLAHKIMTNHIFSNSWGPSDFGQSVEGPGMLASRTMKKAIEVGRCGLGTVYVVASGNGGLFDDNCNFDGYANSIYTVTIGSITEDHHSPHYSEECTAQFGVTYSSDSYNGRKVTTTDVSWLRGGCAKGDAGLTGTSASAPMAAGMIALMLDARWCLTWRDVQHILVYSAIPLGDSGEWKRNGAGFLYHDKFGFGILKASRLVHAAKVWELVPKQLLWSSELDSVGYAIPSFPEALEREVIVPNGEIDEIFRSLEHVTLTVNIKHPRRGNLKITIISPNNSEAVVATPRSRDDSDRRLEWTFSTVKFWGESPLGKWKVWIEDIGEAELHGFLESFQLTLYGNSLSRSEINKRKGLVDDEEAPVHLCGQRVTCPDESFSDFGFVTTTKPVDLHVKELIVVIAFIVVFALVLYLIFFLMQKFVKSDYFPSVLFRTAGGRNNEENVRLLNEENVEVNFEDARSNQDTVSNDQFDNSEPNSEHQDETEIPFISQNQISRSSGSSYDGDLEGEDDSSSRQHTVKVHPVLSSPQKPADALSIGRFNVENGHLSDELDDDRRRPLTSLKVVDTTTEPQCSGSSDIAIDDSGEAGTGTSGFVAMATETSNNSKPPVIDMTGMPLEEYQESSERTKLL